jgi:hypothetical protein
VLKTEFEPELPELPGIADFDTRTASTNSDCKSRVKPELPLKEVHLFYNHQHHHHHAFLSSTATTTSNYQITNR